MAARRVLVMTVFLAALLAGCGRGATAGASASATAVAETVLPVGSWDIQCGDGFVALVKVQAVPGGGAPVAITVAGRALALVPASGGYQSHDGTFRLDMSHGDAGAPLIELHEGAITHAACTAIQHS